ncbi:MAG: hypothetical protein KGM24_03330 [Elusimicrobia bacterium]|nr:hypothetical protein [Elusimicrobiota bacterium]
MSVSSHLTPEPERRLWLILEGVRDEAERAEWKCAALAALCAVELARAPEPARALLALSAAAGVLALLPFPHKPRRVPLLDPAPARASGDDRLISPHDAIKYAYGELVLKLDRYLGGGVSTTPYYEDLVAEIALNARRAARKRRVLALVAVLTALGQLTFIVGIR